MIAEPGPWLETSDAIPMFPTFVWQVSLKAESRDAIATDVLALLAGLRRDLPPLEPGQGWQSGQALHECAELQALFSCVRHLAGSILRFLRIRQADLEVTGCWATILSRGAMHRVHSHPNNFLSGVYYIRVPPGADTINFHDPRSQSRVIRPPVTELTAENTDQVVVRVQNGTLLMFPSYLDHSVDTNTVDDERISISFNMMFPAFTENLSKPLW
jgi:uncharacterized protein (TIGR02466 family)